MLDIRIHNGNYITVYKHSCLNLVIYPVKIKIVIELSSSNDAKDT